MIEPIAGDAVVITGSRIHPEFNGQQGTVTQNVAGSVGVRLTDGRKIYVCEDEVAPAFEGGQK